MFAKRWMVLAILSGLVLLLGACSASAAPGPATLAPSTPAILPITVTAHSSGGASQSLEGTHWILVSLGPSATAKPIVAGTRPTLEFGAGGQAIGNTGCNSFGGQYTVTGDRIKFAQIISTMRACVDPNAQAQNKTYLDALNSASRFERAGRNLKIWYDNGSSILTFIAS